MPAVDMAGRRFGRYTVLYRSENDKHGNAMWMCKCDCGNQKIVAGSALRKGVTLSCGCYHKEKVAKINTTHGESKSRLFGIWQSMKARCNNPNHKHYSYYGGKGISVCEEWKHDFQSFADWANNNGYSEGLTIDRIDPIGNYEPSNCRWLSRAEQQKHLSNCRLFEVDGETNPLNTWCKIYNMPHETVRKRIAKGWDIKEALTVPPDKRYSHNAYTK